MNRQEYMKELAYLLQDMPEEERAEALQYYEDYFDDAGEQEEAAVIAELGSPEKVAAMIRYGDNAEQSEYTERGYENPGYREPFYEVGDHVGRRGEGQAQTGREDEYRGRPPRRGCLYYVLWGILLICLLPVALGAGGTAIGVLAAIAAVLLGIGLSLAIITLCLFITGVILIPLGIIKLVSIPVLGVFMIACGCILFGLGILFLILSVLVYGRALPGLFRWCTRLIGSLFHRGGATA